MQMARRASLSSKCRICPSRRGPRVRGRRCCTSTQRCPHSTICKSSINAHWAWGRVCSTIAPTIQMSHCSSTPTLQAIPSASSWDRDEPPVGLLLCPLDECLGLVEGCHFAVHCLLHRLGHQDL